MERSLLHVGICICTYKRPASLRRLLNALQCLPPAPDYDCSIVVADNDVARSAEATVREFSLGSPVPITYCVEPRQNIALARNKAIENTSADLIAFIDDDEVPGPGWLSQLLATLKAYEADGVLGPVKRRFDEVPPAWVLKGGFYDRAVVPTGVPLQWTEGRTGNVLFRKAIVDNLDQPFRPEFRAGEDQDFFRRMILDGRRFVWCADAVVFEVIPPARWNTRIMVRRALLRGATTVLHPTFGARDVLKSLVAVPLYLLALPFTALFDRGRFMSFLVRLFDHLGKLLALVGMNPIREQYITD